MTPPKNIPKTQARDGHNRPSPWRERIIVRYSDAYIERWGEVFVKHDLHQRLAIPFEVFLRWPRAYLQQLNRGNKKEEAV